MLSNIQEGSSFLIHFSYTLPSSFYATYFPHKFYTLFGLWLAQQESNSVSFKCEYTPSIPGKTKIKYIPAGELKIGGYSSGGDGNILDIFTTHWKIFAIAGGVIILIIVIIIIICVKKRKSSDKDEDGYKSQGYNYNSYVYKGFRIEPNRISKPLGAVPKKRTAPVSSRFDLTPGF